jgi:hypothetical protein
VSTTISQFDLENLYNWEEIHTTYDENGIIENRIKLWDTGVSIDEAFTSGIRHSMLQQDNSADGLAVNWQSIDSSYDSNGQLDQRSILYDNNVTRQEGFESGVKTFIAQQDDSTDGSAKNWQHTETRFDENGQISSISTLLDTDVYEGSAYENGVKRYTVQADQSVGSTAVNWQTIETTYDVNGNLSMRTTVYDVDVTKGEYFEGGIRRFTSEQDLSADGSARKWHTREIEYNESGQLQSRITLADTGVSTSEYFENGIRRFTSQEDQSPDGLGVHWQTKENEYDANGQQITRTIDYDNGLRDFVGYENGSKVFRLQEDNSTDGSVVSWQSIETYYDANGRLGYQKTIYDNGIEKGVVYSNGVKSSILEEDKSADGLSADWKHRATDFDTAGIIELRQTLFDTDIFELISFQNGIRDISLQTDQSTDGSAKDWQSFTTQYDGNGIIDRSSVVYDDADSMISLYESGNINAQLDIDGDDSEAWGAREVRYDQNGNVSVTIFYDSAEDAPLEFFGDLFV